MPFLFDILDCAPPNVKLRDVQKRALLFIQENWETKKFFMLNVPVAGGKSIIAVTCTNWIAKNGIGQSALVTPIKALQDQYERDFQEILMLKGSSSYQCLATPMGNCKGSKAIFGEYCKGGSCGFVNTFKACKTAQTSLYNTHSYIWGKQWKENVIFDEFHNAQNFLFDLYNIKLWQPEWGFDKDMEPTRENVIGVVEKAIETLNEQYQNALSKKIVNQIEELDEKIKKYETTLDGLNSFGKDILIVAKEEEYNGKLAKNAKKTQQICINIKPLKVSSFAGQTLWPTGFTKKVVMMSATVNRADAKEYGIPEEEFAYFESESPIPKERRPFISYPVASMNWKNQTEALPVITKAILQLAERHKDHKGIIHCTYSLAKTFEAKFKGNPRFLFHNNVNKNEVYEAWKKSNGNKVLFASGMSEGLDLFEDLARWQIILKVQYPSLADDVSAYRMHNNSQLYQWDTIKTMVQQSGRICRGPTDYGYTYILDKEFLTFWNRTKNSGLWPKWFVESIVFIDVK
jgi:hypothetical protein